MERDREKHKVELSKLQGQVSNLTQTIQRNESVIIMLKKQLASKQKVEEVIINSVNLAIKQLLSLSCSLMSFVHASPSFILTITQRNFKL